MTPRPGAARLASDLLLALASVAGVTALGRAAHANAATIGFVYLVVVLVVALRSSLATALAASVAATGCFNYFFFPPVGTFTIADPSNWVALGTFFLASFVVTRLVARSERRAREAESRRREVEALYDLSVDLFTSTNRIGGVGEAAGRALRTLGARGSGLQVLSEGGSGPRLERVFGGAEPPENALVVESVARRGEVVEVPAPGGERDVYLPLVLGGRPVGVLVAHGIRSGGAALQSVGRLVALAVERERFLAERLHMDSLRESDALKTSILRAVSHDLRSPVTAIRAGLEGLRRRTPEGETLSGLVSVSREAERLSRRIDNLLAMARLDAGTLAPAPEPVPAGDLFRAALEQLPLVLAGRRVDASVEAETPDVYADPVLAVEVLVNLLENAARVSPADSAIELLAAPDPFDAARVQLDVRDRGPGVPPGLRTGAAPGDTGAGLGLEICRGLARALSGSVVHLGRPGGGTIARFEVPAARMAP